ASRGRDGARGETRTWRRSRLQKAVWGAAAKGGNGAGGRPRRRPRACGLRPSCAFLRGQRGGADRGSSWHTTRAAGGRGGSCRGLRGRSGGQGWSEPPWRRATAGGGRRGAARSKG